MANDPPENNKRPLCMNVLDGVAWAIAKGYITIRLSEFAWLGHYD